jgi:hypothetical protein
MTFKNFEFFIRIFIGHLDIVLYLVHKLCVMRLFAIQATLLLSII